MKNLKYQQLNNTKLFFIIRKYFAFILALLDAIISAILFFLSFHIIKFSLYPNLSFNNQHYIFSVFLIIIITILLQTTNISKIPRTSRYLSIFFDFVRFTIILSTLSFIFKFLLKLDSVSIYLLTIFLIVNHFGLFLFRIKTYRFFKNYRISGCNYRNVLVIAGEHSEHIIKKIKNNKEWGFRILAILTNSDEIRNKFESQIKIYPERINIKSLLDIDIIDEVIYCKSKFDKTLLNEIVDACQEVGVTFRFQSDFTPVTYENGFLTQLEDIPMLTVMNTPKNQIALAWKTLSESLFAFLILLTLSPFILLIAILIRIDSKGSSFFKQKRVGLRGRQFYIYKFRTMVVKAEELKDKLQNMNESDGPTFKIKKDPRITKIGSFLRRTSLDELPQLINVLKGEMALIGPRPPLPDEVDKYKRWQLRRLSVKPGLTCTWQIIPNRNDVVFEKWVKLDLQYIDNWSLTRDMKLFLKTIKAVFVNDGC